MGTGRSSRVGAGAIRVAVLICVAARARIMPAQAALLLEQPYGVFGTLNPTGHAAVYLERVCAETPVRLRMCAPGESGSVISRYKGMDGYDWVAIPLIPYLYAVDDPEQAPLQVDQKTVDRLREHYKEARLGGWDERLPRGSFFYAGWTELVGTAYDRRTYAFRFETTREQDEALVAMFNERPNRSHFNLLFNNCADFDRLILRHYFPGKFGRTVFPDAGITTPKRIAWGLVQYAKKHPEMRLTVLEIPQVPGFRHTSRAVHGVTETLFANGYVVPIVFMNPYLAGGLLVDYLVRGRYNLIPKEPAKLDAMHMDALLQPLRAAPSDTTQACLAGLGRRCAGASSDAVGLPVSGETPVAAHQIYSGSAGAASPVSLPQQ